MDSDQEVNPELLRRKARRATRMAIVFCFLLALFWPVHAFFAWAFLGGAVYCGFLMWFYSAQAKPREPKWQQPGTYDAASDGTKKISLPIAIALVIGVVFFGTITTVVIFGSESPEDVSSENIAAEEATDEPGEVAGDNEIDGLTNRGNALYDAGKYDSAMVFYNRVLAKDPSNQFAQYNQGLVYYAKKDYARSVSVLRGCLREHPDYGEAYWLLGSDYYDRQRLDSAKLCFDRAYEKGVRNGGFLQAIAALYENSDPPKAIALYKESVQQDSSLVDSYRKLRVLESSNSSAYEQLIKRWAKN